MPKAKIGDITLNYTIRGEGDWLVLIGGYASGNWQAWGGQLDAFAKHFKVLAFDNRGIGESDVPEGPYTTRMMARDTLGLMAHLGIERAHVFGKSLGGCIAQWVALEEPSRVRSVVMTSTFSRPMERAKNMVRWWMATAEHAGFDKLFPGLMTYFYSETYYDANAASIAKTVRALIEAKRPLPGFLAMGQSLLTHDTWARLPEIAAPCLLLGGDEDIITPARQIEEMGRRIPNAEVVIYPKTGHGFMTERPDAFDTVLAFFAKH